jgi:hypothetical protein
VTTVTSPGASKTYLGCIKGSDEPQRQPGSQQMSKFICLAAALFAPVAFATLNQAALIVA